MKRQFLLYSVVLFFIPNVFADVLPQVQSTPNEQQQIWSRYCLGNRESTDIPQPNYKNDDVLAATKKLAMISPLSYYFYSGPLYAYDLRDSKTKDLVDVPASFPQGIQEVKSGKKNAHAFLTVLCGEFRDRPTLIKDKIRWVLRMHTLPDAVQKPINLNNDLWSQVSARSYANYIGNTRIIFAMKQRENQLQKLSSRMGKYNEDYPVEPFSVCETKFIFKKYVETNSQFNYNKASEFANYKKEYAKFKDRCPADDLQHFYDFRGDSNFKPNSPESNGMIWYSSTIAGSCIRKDGKMILKDSVKDKFADPEICEKYFMRPFAYRWLAARAGLATWLFYNPTYDAQFSNSREKVTVTPHLEPSIKPFGFKLLFSQKFALDEILSQNSQGEYVMWDDATGKEIILTKDQAEEKKKQIEQKKAEMEAKKKEEEAIKFDFIQSWQDQQSEFWKRADIGFNQVVGFEQNASSTNKELAFERLRNAVNRHTDWYASSYDDGLGTVRDQAYSPFVASSYEMSASDAFTSPGVTVKSPADGCKHWMFVFKLKNDQWYNTNSIVNRTPVDFNRHWFDETSLGTNRLADSEHALDRLGTALEGEMDSILYLHNITREGVVNAACGAEQMKIN